MKILLEKFVSRRFVLSLIGIIVMVVWGDTHAIDPSFTMDGIVKIVLFGIGFIGLADVVKELKSPELKSILENLLKSPEEPPSRDR